jgi:hypothetical protein
MKRCTSARTAPAFSSRASTRRVALLQLQLASRTRYRFQPGTLDPSALIQLHSISVTLLSTLTDSFLIDLSSSERPGAHDRAAAAAAAVLLSI